MARRAPSLAPDELRFAVLAVDAVLFTIRENVLYVRLTAVHRLPQYPDARAFPGGLIKPNETAEEAVFRLIAEKAGIDPKKVHSEQLYTFSALNRDPRGRVVSVAYLCLVAWEHLTEIEQSDTENACWVPLSAVGTLAYDHVAMLTVARTRLRSRIAYTTLIARLLPRTFTLTELEKTYACILGTKLDKRNFRKKILKLGILKALNRKRIAGRSRPAELYRFASSVIKEIEII